MFKHDNASAKIVKGSDSFDLISRWETYLGLILPMKHGGLHK